MNKFDRSINKFSCLKNIPNDNNSIRDNRIISLCEDEGIIWVATGSGLSKLNIKASILRRKMSALFNNSPNEFILRFRLNKAAKLIKEEGKSGTKAAYETGFDNLTYFSKCYRSEFGQLPFESNN